MYAEAEDRRRTEEEDDWLNVYEGLSIEARLDHADWRVKEAHRDQRQDVWRTRGDV